MLVFPYGMRETASMTCRVIDSPIGAIAISASNDGLEAIDIVGNSVSPDDVSHPLIDEAVLQIRAYFIGKLRTFDLPLAPKSTKRGNELREAIIAIPYGEVASYGEIAHKASSGPRAIGGACKRNEFPIIVPCHRVIAAGGKIGYYSGGTGIPTKRFLIEHENPEEKLL